MCTRQRKAAKSVSDARIAAHAALKKVIPIAAAANIVINSMSDRDCGFPGGEPQSFTSVLVISNHRICFSGSCSLVLEDRGMM